MPESVAVDPENGATVEGMDTTVVVPTRAVVPPASPANVPTVLDGDRVGVVVDDAPAVPAKLAAT